MEPSARAVAEDVVEDVGDSDGAVTVVTLVLEPVPEIPFNVDTKSERLAPGMTMTAVESDIVIVPDDTGIRIVNVDDIPVTLEAGMDGKEMGVAVLWMTVFAVVPSLCGTETPVGVSEPYTEGLGVVYIWADVREGYAPADVVLSNVNEGYAVPDISGGGKVGVVVILLWNVNEGYAVVVVVGGGGVGVLVVVLWNVNEGYAAAVVAKSVVSEVASGGKGGVVVVVLWNVNEGYAAAVVTTKGGVVVGVLWNVNEGYAAGSMVSVGIGLVVVVVDCEVNERYAVDTVVSVT
jgi:hypothetical protein